LAADSKSVCSWRSVHSRVARMEGRNLRRTIMCGHSEKGWKSFHRAGAPINHGNVCLCHFRDIST
jgi:hypothetical protein